jgi:ubiquinone/menaquinone biosynthesis C-methylase UbiE
MKISRFIAAQLGKPSGIFAKFTGFIWNRRNAALNDTVFDLLALRPTDRVLDIGFGGGYLFNRMMTVVTDGLIAGVDVSSAMVVYTEKRYQKAIDAGKLEFKCAAVELLPYPAKYFTKVCSVNSIFYWQNTEQGIREIKRVLEPGGKIVLCFTGKASIETKAFAKYIQLFKADEVEQILDKSGFQDIKPMHFSDHYRQYICITARSESCYSSKSN